MILRALLYYTLKISPQRNNSQFVSYNGSIYTVLRNQSGGCGEIGPVYRASFRLQSGNGIGSFFRRLFRFVKPPLYSGAKAVGKEAFETGSHIITDFHNKEPEQTVGDIFKNRFGEAKNNLQEKIKNDGVWLEFKKEAETEKSSVSK